MVNEWVIRRMIIILVRLDNIIRKGVLIERMFKDWVLVLVNLLKDRGNKKIKVWRVVSEVRRKLGE